MVIGGVEEERIQFNVDSLWTCDENLIGDHDRKWKGEHPHAWVTSQVDKAAKQSYEKLLAAHVRDHQPLFNLLTASIEPFRKATKLSFGEEIRGFTIRTFHNPFGGMDCKWNIPASAWYAQHFWEHYAFGQDKEFLETVAYPFLREVSANALPTSGTDAGRGVVSRSTATST